MRDLSGDCARVETGNIGFKPLILGLKAPRVHSDHCDRSGPIGLVLGDCLGLLLITGVITHDKKLLLSCLL